MESGAKCASASVARNARFPPVGRKLALPNSITIAMLRTVPPGIIATLASIFPPADVRIDQLRRFVEAIATSIRALDNDGRLVIDARRLRFLRSPHLEIGMDGNDIVISYRSRSLSDPTFVGATFAAA